MNWLHCSGGILLSIFRQKIEENLDPFKSGVRSIRFSQECIHRRTLQALTKLRTKDQTLDPSYKSRMPPLFLLIVSLAVSAIVLASPSVKSIAQVASKHKFVAHSKGFTVSNIATGGFPANPKYGVMQFYDDEDCSNKLESSSYLLDTCMASDTASLKYTCGRYLSNFVMKTCLLAII